MKETHNELPVASDTIVLNTNANPSQNASLNAIQNQGSYWWFLFSLFFPKIGFVIGLFLWNKKRKTSIGLMSIVLLRVSIALCLVIFYILIEALSSFF